MSPVYFVAENPEQLLFPLRYALTWENRVICLSDSFVALRGVFAEARWCCDEPGRLALLDRSQGLEIVAHQEPGDSIADPAPEPFPVVHHGQADLVELTA